MAALFIKVAVFRLFVNTTCSYRSLGVVMASLRPNRVKQKMSNGDVAVGVMGPVMTADLIDVLGPMGFDGWKASTDLWILVIFLT